MWFSKKLKGKRLEFVFGAFKGNGILEKSFKGEFRAALLSNAFRSESTEAVANFDMWYGIRVVSEERNPQNLSHEGLSYENIGDVIDSDELDFDELLTPMDEPNLVDWLKERRELECTVSDSIGREITAKLCNVIVSDGLYLELGGNREGEKLWYIAWRNTAMIWFKRELAGAPGMESAAIERDQNSDRDDGGETTGVTSPLFPSTGGGSATAVPENEELPVQKR